MDNANGARGESLHNPKWRKLAVLQNTPRLAPRDPLSPLFFNLTADALDHILGKAKEKGHIQGCKRKVLGIP